MLRKIATMSAVTLGLSAGAASAGTIYAQAVTAFSAEGVTSCELSDDKGGTAVRTNICNALGKEDHPGGNSEVGFLSAGNYDALKFTFGGPFAGPVDFFEITFGNRDGWAESIAFLLTGYGGATFAKLSEVTDPTVDLSNTDGAVDPTNGSRWILTYDQDLGPFNALWVFDTTGEDKTPDAIGGGFDIDAIGAVSVSPVPLPAAGFLLIAGLGGLALMRRRS